MTHAVELLDAAKADLAAAVAWYNGCHLGIGDAFLASVEALISRIASHPHLYARIDGRFRRAALQRFPFVVVYRGDGDRVLVVAIHHTSRQPDHWRSRLQ